jgi:hypothetical protein
MSADHIYVVAAGASPVEPQAHWWCKHCDERAVQSFPIKVDTWLAMSEGFMKAHKGCRSPAGTEGGNDA